MGLRECRALVNIPVVAPTESASVLACALGNKFSIINLQPSADPGIELAVRNAGVIGKLASIRCPPGLTVPKAFSLSLGNKSEQKRLIEMLTNEMVRAVIEDKAEALFISCTHTSAFLSSQGIREVEEVPVLDIFAASLKMAETYLALKRGYETKVCRKSVYMAPSADWETQISQP